MKRTEHDSLGPVDVPAEALYGAQTQRAVDNFNISERRLQPAFIHALAHIKAACAKTNAELGLLDQDAAQAIEAAAKRIIAGEFYDQFPVDVFQTGSGTSTNMNMNEVLSHLVERDSGLTLHPNDHINMSQSSNDVIPTALHLSNLNELHLTLLPALRHLDDTIRRKASTLHEVVKTGRTHLMDAMPLTMEQELTGWHHQLTASIERLDQVTPRLAQLAQGGTAVGTGINAPVAFPRLFCRHLSAQTGMTLSPAKSFFTALSSQDTALELSAAMRTCATTLIKIADDLRWMNSGPLAGVGEIELQALQPGSSIMPGKVNPVIPEAVLMTCMQVCGNDTTVALSAQRSNFQLNVMLPVIAYNLLESQSLLANAANALGEKAIASFEVRQERIEQALSRNPILVTALNRVIGYEKAAALAKQAYAEGRPIIDVVEQETELNREELEQMLDPHLLTRPGG
ncbi:Fumarate hydratase class II [Marinobacterium lacunae]|uniref:Fumarate hydratase class II n=1 Tax=Marinobacterium lacunae TaxID=1232683 RepID=A0A081G1U9_9GAMM|nr:class II fumarate hydratase [Marinobacterium lacunae]KEA64754.1 Fumarate hydratase class II [Marinobacterium lacunae]MBR9883256.1 class II fumarate hydratase [Oceanospirillales bacterium]